MRNSKENIDIRREKVKILIALAFPQHEIAKQLGCSPRTIFSDIKEIRKGWKSQIEKIDLDQIVSEMQYELNNQRRELYEILQESTNPQIKISAIRTLGEIIDRLLNLLQSVGKVHKEPEKIRADVFQVISAVPRPRNNNVAKNNKTKKNNASGKKRNND